MTREILHRCNFCGATFTTEARFLRHECTAMIREKDFKSVAGQSAWNHYKSWMKVKHKSVPSSATAFKKSKYFTTFFNFTKFVKKTQLPDIAVFIELMVRSGIDPNYWSSDTAYRKYLEYITRKLPTRELVKITIKTLFDIADAAEVDVGEVFNILTPNEVIQLLHQRRLSPWMLLNSKKFANFYINDTSSEERIVMETIVNPDYWTGRFNKQPKDVEIVKQYVTELGL